MSASSNTNTPAVPAGTGAMQGNGSANAGAAAPAGTGAAQDSGSTNAGTAAPAGAGAAQDNGSTNAGAAAPAGAGAVQNNGKRKRTGPPLDRHSAWVADIIQEATTREVHEELKANFLSSSPNMAAATAFFKQLNEKICNANINHNTNLDDGLVPKFTYHNLFNNWMKNMERAKKLNNAETAWHVFDFTYGKLKIFNQEHTLPQEWNITDQPARDFFSDRVVRSVEGNENDQAPDMEMPDYDEDSDDNVTDLDDLKADTRQDLAFLDGEVLFWWKRGTGSQVFIRYGSELNGIYRIRTGSSETYDPDSVPCLFSTSKRGQEREFFVNSQGRQEECLKWKRDHVHGIVGVGWKLEDDDEESLEPLDLVWPEPYAKYPHTHILVQWKDKQVTLEDRSFVCHITKGSSLQGDRVIYQKALTQEICFRREEQLPFEHLLDHVPGARQASVHGDELESDEEIEEEPPQVDETNSGPRGSVRASSASNAGRVSNRERSKTSEVRFVEPKPSTRTTSKSESIRPSSRAYSQSVENSDPRDAEISFLKSQIESLQKEANQRPGSQRALRYNDRYYDRASAVSETPEPQHRRLAQRKVWNNWAGRWVPARRAY